MKKKQYPKLFNLNDKHFRGNLGLAMLVLLPLWLPIWLVAKTVQKVAISCGDDEVTETVSEEQHNASEMDSEVDSVLQYLTLDNDTALAVMGYIRDPGWKAIIKVCDADGLSIKSWKIAVVCAHDKVKNKKRFYIRLDGKKYYIDATKIGMKPGA